MYTPDLYLSADCAMRSFHAASSREKDLLEVSEARVVRVSMESVRRHVRNTEGLYSGVLMILREHTLAHKILPKTRSCCCCNSVCVSSLHMTMVGVGGSVEGQSGGKLSKDIERNETN